MQFCMQLLICHNLLAFLVSHLKELLHFHEIWENTLKNNLFCQYRTPLASVHSFIVTTWKRATSAVLKN